MATVSQEDKLRHEIETLQLEKKERQRSFLHQPTFLSPVATIAISLSGNILQWSNCKTKRHRSISRSHRQSWIKTKPTVAGHSYGAPPGIINTLTEMSP